MIQKIDHIGIAVKSLEEARKYYEEGLGLTCEHVEIVESQKVKTAFFNVNGVHIELLEPTSEESPIAKFLEKKGEGIHHIAFGTNDVQSQLDKVKDAGINVIHDKPFAGAGGKQVAFLHPKSTYGVLTELCSGEGH